MKTRNELEKELSTNRISSYRKDVANIGADSKRTELLALAKSLKTIAKDNTVIASLPELHSQAIASKAVIQEMVLELSKLQNAEELLKKLLDNVNETVN